MFLSDLTMCASSILHLPGMLDRDQRTVKLRYHQKYKKIRKFQTILKPNASTILIDTNSTSSNYSSLAPKIIKRVSLSTNCTTTKFNNNVTTYSDNIPKYNKQFSSVKKSWRKKKTFQSTWKILQRLRPLLLFLLSINYLPLISSAPTSKHNMSDRMNSHPKWINPCGMGQTDLLMAHDVTDTVVVSDRDLLSQIVLTAKLALAEAENFREEYVEKTFSTDFHQHHQLWKSHRYDWLPNVEQIPKDLGEETPRTHLESLELNKSLLDTYEYLQTIAVGLEQLVWDQEDDEGPFYGKFKDIEFKLRALLCEIQVAILERNINMRPDVRRDIMTEAFRNMPSKYLRDWLIFRDFMNALEYTIQVFNYLQDAL